MREELTAEGPLEHVIKIINKSPACWGNTFATA